MPPWRLAAAAQPDDDQKAGEGCRHHIDHQWQLLREQGLHGVAHDQVIGRAQDGLRQTARCRSALRCRAGCRRLAVSRARSGPCSSWGALWVLRQAGRCGIRWPLSQMRCWKLPVNAHGPDLLEGAVLVRLQPEMASQRAMPLLGIWRAAQVSGRVTARHRRPDWRMAA